MTLGPLRTSGALLATFLFLVASVTVSVQAKDPVEEPADQPIAKRILGHWEIDRGHMLKMMLARAVEEAGEEDLDQGTEELMREMINQLAVKMVLEFTADGLARVHSAEQEEDSTYKILKADQNTGEFTFEVKSPGRKVDTAAAKLNGDQLSLKSDQTELYFRRLSGEQAKARLAVIEKKAEEGKGQEDPAEDEEDEEDQE